jgi:hypothetical protein
MEEQTKEQLEEISFFEFLNAREAALQGAAGYFTIANVPTAYLREIVRASAGDPASIIALAAQTALYARGEDWRVSPLP